jgi:hypothetical protein
VRPHSVLSSRLDGGGSDRCMHFGGELGVLR